MGARKRYQSIGKALPREEAAGKVSGETRYAADITPPGTLWAKILRSPHAHARIVSADTSRARDLPGVHVVLTGKDLPQVLMGKRIKDIPVLARERVRYVGEPVAAVAAENPEIAEEALSLIEIGYEELPSVTDPLEAIKPGAPRIHENPARYKNAERPEVESPNLQSVKVWQRGDLAPAFAGAERIFEHTFRTQLTHHGYIEPHACLVSVTPQGGVEIWASNKSPFALRDQLGEDLGISADRVKVHILSVGGDFGGKASLIDVPICYFLAERSGRPVKSVLGYAEELTASSHRHPSVITLRTGVKRDGTLTAMEARVVFDGGAYAGLKHAVGGGLGGPRFAGSSYRIPAVRIEAIIAYTNHVPGTQVRSPGCPQTVFAVESQLDLIARELGMDPVEFRLRNLLDNGEPNPLGQEWREIRAKETLRQAARSSRWSQRKKLRYRGRGVAVFERGTNSGRSGAAITLDKEGGVTVFIGVPDVGPGISTVVQQIVAEALGVAVKRVQVEVGDTDTVPYDAGVGGSRSTNTAGHAAYKAACEVREKLVEAAATNFGCGRDQVEQRNGSFRGPGRKALSFQKASSLLISKQGGSFSHGVNLEPSSQSPVTSFCSQVAEVEVDPESGQVRLKKLVTAHDAGTVLNRLTHQGQIDGGLIQGMGFALMEETSLLDGRIATTHMGEFKIPTIKDVPELSTVILESPTGPAPYQGKAIGEIPNVPTAAAIANAIADAVGVRFFKLPITSEEIHRALKKRAGAGR